MFCHNISIICPAIFSYVFSCYTLPSPLSIFGGYKINLVGGTSQGDPVAIAINAIAVILLLFMVLETVTTCSNDNVKMAAYAHFTAGASIKSLKYVWGTLLIVDSQYGYYPEATKTGI